MGRRKNFPSGAEWEAIVGYSRAVEINGVLEISGTVATVGPGQVGERDFYGQTRDALKKIERVLKEAGYRIKDVVRTRMFVTDISHWEEIGKAHGEFFADVCPVTTMVQVSALIDPKYVVEIEATAVRV